MTFALEVQDSGQRFTVVGDDAMDAALRWARGKTLQWWRDNGPEVIVLIEGREYRLGLSLNLSCEEVKRG